MPRQHQFTTTARHIERALHELHCNRGALAKKLGISGSAVGKWLLDDKSPVWSVLACEALIGHAQRLDVVVCSPQSTDSQGALIALLKALNVPFTVVKP